MQASGTLREQLPWFIETLQGRLGDEIGYVVHGRQRWRRYVKPADPRTKRQLCRRRAFARLVLRWHALTEAEKEYWNTLARRSRCKRIKGFNLFLSSGMKEFEAAQRIEAIRSSVKSFCRRFVRVKAGSNYTAEWHALLLHAIIISPAFQYRRE